MLVLVETPEKTDVEEQVIIETNDKDKVSLFLDLFKKQLKELNGDAGNVTINHDNQLSPA